MELDTWQIYTADAEGTNRGRLTSAKSFAQFSDWSPDGKQVVFEVQGQIYLIDSEGGSERFLTEGGRPSWSRSGEWIYFKTRPEGRYRSWGPLKRIRPEAGEVFPIEGALGTRPLESADGRYLYYFRRNENTDQRSIYRIQLKGGKEELIQDVLSTERSWDVQGNRLYWVEIETDTTYSLKYRDLRTGKIERYYQLPYPRVWGMAVSPDEKWIYYSTRDTELTRDISLVENLR
jgi:tricorn protease-like protein